MELLILCALCRQPPAPPPMPLYDYEQNAVYVYQPPVIIQQRVIIQEQSSYRWYNPND